MTQTSDTEPHADVAALDPRRWSALVLLALVQFMFALDSTIVNTALPTIQRDLGFSVSGLAWVVNGYVLMAGGFLILGGRIADIVGRRRMFVVGTAVFAAASAVSGLAQNPATLIAARFGQGLGEALAAPAALSLVVLLFHDQTERAKAIGIWGGITGLGATIGVVVSGFIVEWLNWRWIFLVNLPIAFTVVFILPRMVSESRMKGDRRLDYVGAILVTGSLTLVVDGLLQASNHGWGSGNVLIPLSAGAVLLVAFVAWQMIVQVPLVPLRFFHNRTRVTANLATIFAGAAFLAMFFTVTLYMQDVLHYSPLKAGLAWGPFGLMLFVGMGTMMKLLPRVGVKPALIASFLISALGLFLLSGIEPHGTYAADLLPGMLLMAFGQAISFIGLQNSALHKLGPADAGLGSAVQNTSLQFGSSLGLAVLVTIALRHTTGRLADGVAPLVAATDGYVWALRLAAATMVVGSLFVALLFEQVSFVAPDDEGLEVAESAAGEPPVEYPTLAAPTR